MYTLDYMFSYWIFAWYVLYKVCIIPYNPKAWIMIAILMSIHNVLTMIRHNYYYMLFLFMIILTILKFIPLYTLFHTKHTFRDFLFGCFLFVVYVAWLTYRRVNVVHVIRSFYFSDKHIKDNDVSKSQTMAWLDSFINIKY